MHRAIDESMPQMQVRECRRQEECFFKFGQHMLSSSLDYVVDFDLSKQHVLKMPHAMNRF